MDNIKKLADELKTNNVIFYGQRPLEEMPELYKIADAMLVTLEDKPYANMTIPGKVQSKAVMLSRVLLLLISVSKRLLIKTAPL